MGDSKGTVGRDGTGAIPLAGGHLRTLRHVCGLFAGADEGYRVLLPFIADGLGRGERAVHIVDPAARASHLERLEGAGIDVGKALQTGQLDVPTWDRTYLDGGRFDAARMVPFIRGALSSGREQGFPITRLIGYMEWALPGVAGTEDLVAYESAVEVTLRGLPDPVICAYDLERHPAALLVRMLDLHPVGVVRGHLGRTGVAPSQPRERILNAASELFSRRGVGATGVDTLIREAGVAKATFYRQFPSKDDLVVAWLRDVPTRWFDRVRRKAEESAGSPDEVIPALFDAVAEWVEAGDFRGCPYLNTSVEIVDPAHPARQPIRDYLDEIQAYLRQVLTSAGLADPAALAAEMQTLLAGGISLAAAYRSTAPILAAREVAARLLSESAGR
jgi:AcrR family transcriptional regulator